MNPPRFFLNLNSLRCALSYIRVPVEKHHFTRILCGYSYGTHRKSSKNGWLQGFAFPKASISALSGGPQISPIWHNQKREQSW
jgi:hypothetical protein